MDINKFKSVAVRKADYDKLKALCDAKFRSPASMIAKVLDGYLDSLAKREKVSKETYIKKLLNGKAN